MVRRIDVSGTVGYWGAIDELMANQAHEGTFEPTLVVMWWDEDTPCLDLGTHEDADMLDADLARDRGFVVGRRHAFAGGTAVHTPEFPNYILYYRRADSTVKVETDKSGEANVAGLEEVGMTAEYDSIGDTEVDVDGTNYKCMAGAASNYHLPDLWTATASVVWDFPPEGQILDEAVSVPREKFEDKDTDSLTSRMMPVSQVLEETGVEATKEEVVDAVAAANVEALLDGNPEIERAEWSDEEQAFLDQVAPFFESDTWINRVSTARMCRRWGSEYDVGLAAYKSEKLIKTSVVLDDDGVIQEALISGDEYVTPHPTVTAGGGLEDLSEAIEGVAVDDADALEAAIQDVFDRDEFELPGIAPIHVVTPIERAGRNRMAIDEYLADH